MDRAKKQLKQDKLRQLRKRSAGSSSGANEAKPSFSAIDVVDAGRLVKELGDNINTRFTADVGDLDADLEQFGQQRVLEAQQDAGTRHKDVAHAVAFDETRCPTVSAFIGHNRYTVTCICVSQLPAASNTGKSGRMVTVVFFGDKAGCVFRCQSKHDPGFTEHRHDMSSAGQMYDKVLLEPRQSSGVCSLAVSNTSGVAGNTGPERTTADVSVKSYFVCGNMDGTMSVWITQTGEFVGKLKMHSAPVTGLDFRFSTHSLYSVSVDGCLRVWSIPEMHAEDKFYGHVGAINCVSALKKERCVTGGADRTMRYWKIDAATQFDFAEQKASIDCVAMLDDNLMIGGAADGTLSIFDVARRGPLFQLPFAHGYGGVGDGTGLECDAMLQSLRDKALGSGASNGASAAPGAGPSSSSASAPAPGLGADAPRYSWLGNGITAVAAVPFSDLVASGSFNGEVVVWRVVGHAQVTKKNPTAGPLSMRVSLQRLTSFKCEGFINSLRFTADGESLLIAAGKDGRMGRWITVSRAMNGAYVVPLMPAAVRRMEPFVAAEREQRSVRARAGADVADAPLPRAAKKSGAAPVKIASKIVRGAGFTTADKLVDTTGDAPLEVVPALQQLSPSMAKRVAKVIPPRVRAAALPPRARSGGGGGGGGDGEDEGSVSDSDFDVDDEPHPMLDPLGHSAGGGAAPPSSSSRGPAGRVGDGEEDNYFDPDDFSGADDFQDGDDWGDDVDDEGTDDEYFAMGEDGQLKLREPTTGAAPSEARAAVAARFADRKGASKKRPIKKGKRKGGPESSPAAAKKAGAVKVKARKGGASKASSDGSIKKKKKLVKKEGADASRLRK